jgi:hypothetical protein
MAFNFEGDLLISQVRIFVFNSGPSLYDGPLVDVPEKPLRLTYPAILEHSSNSLREK